jgi:hypothetical protein
LFKLVLIALRKLILQYDIEEHLADTILPYPCYALAYLCDGRKTMVVENDFFGKVIVSVSLCLLSKSLFGFSMVNTFCGFFIFTFTIF